MAARFIQEENARAKRPGVFDGPFGCRTNPKQVGESSSGNGFVLGTIEAIADASVKGTGCNHNARCSDIPQ